MRRLRSSELLPFILAAALGALAMDFPQTLWPLIFVCLTPLLWYRDTHADAFLEKHGALRLFGKMFLFGFLFAVASTPWFASTYPLTWLNIYDPVLSVAIIVLIWASFAVAMSLPMTIWIFGLYKLRPKSLFLEALIGAALWITLEYARSWLVALSVYGHGVLFGPHHTYYSLAYVISSAPVLRDLLALGGMYLTSFFIVLVNFFVYYAILFWKKGGKHLSALLPLALLIVAMATIGFVGAGLMRATNTSHTGFVASVVNTYLPSTVDATVAAKKSAVAADIISHIDNSRGIIFLPENLNVLTPYLNDPHKDKNSLSKDHLVIGSYPGTESHDMYFFEPQTERVLYYTKQLLMPIGEYSVSWVHFLIRASGNRQWLTVYEKMTASNPAHGEGITLYPDKTIPNLLLASSICAENISPYIFRDETRAGATVLSNISSLSPFRDNPTLSRQTIAIDTTRALENGRYFIVASNDNRSFVVTDEGNLVHITDDSHANTYFNANILTKDYDTPYVLYGDYALYMAFGIVVLACVWLLA